MRVVVMALLGLLATSAGAVDVVSLHALFKDKAILMVDGQRRVLARGATSPEGVKLIATDTVAEQAEVEINGRREVVKLGMVMAGFHPATQASVTLWVGSNGHFHADGTINGAAVRFLVDTGATSIAMSSVEAKRLGIDYEKRGRPSYATTAGGLVRTHVLKLDTVQVGAITLHNVEAGVVEGAYPREALLGMSFLGRLDMKRTGDQLELTQRY